MNHSTIILNKQNSFCISLESKPERWIRMQNRLQLFDLSVNKWNATTPDNLVDTFYHGMNPYQKACAQSHINIWRYMVLHHLEYVFILEDDACFDKQWLDKLKLFSNHIGDEPWDAIFLNASEPMECINTWDIILEQYLTGGYILSLRGAMRLLDRFKDCFYSSDWMTSRLQEFGACYSYFPWLIIQEGIESTIGSGVEIDHEKVVRCLNEIEYSLDNYV